jgi:miniconductance mechanosensitive channel
MFDSLTDIFKEWLLKVGLSENIALIIIDYSFFILLVIACYITYIIAKRIINSIVLDAVHKSKTQWDDYILKRKVFSRIAFLFPLFLLNFFTDYILIKHEITTDVINKTVEILIVIVSISILNGVINSFSDIYNTYKISKSRPIKGYIQVIKIVIFILAGALIISVLIGEDGFKWLAGFGAFSAVLMLIFKDPILGFVGGIQLTSNNMVQIGDWISMPKFGADGNVIDITLTTVKVQNFDKTITTIPTYTLVTDYFQNWRGMEESGGRRIKRSINIDMTSVSFCNAEILTKFESFHFIKNYISKKNRELFDYNKKYGFDGTNLVNGRRQTNLGIFRAYLKEYLHHKPEINTEMTFLVRQLQPGENGLPIEIYIFSKIQEWDLYEDIQSDIFDHILAVIPEFGLKVYQNPSGSDFQNLLKN